MCEPISTATLLYAALGATAATTAATVYTGEKNRSAQHDAQDKAALQAQETAAQSANATNRANAKGPDSAAMLSANMLAGQSGQASTMLTGPSGVDPSQLTLGKSSLLGGS